MREVSIRRKLVLFFSVMILSVLSLFIYILSSAFSYLQIYEEDLIKTSLVQYLSNTISDSNGKFENAIKNYNNINREMFNDTIEPIWSSWVDVKNRTNSSQETFFQIEAIRYGMLAYIESAKKSVEVINRDLDTFSYESYRARRIYGYVTSYLHKLIDIRLEESARLHETQKEKIAKIRVISFLAIAIMGIVCLIFSNFFSITLTNPIINLANNARLMAQGNLNVESITTKSNDEIGILTKSFNDMSKSINLLVDSLKDKAKIEKQHLEDEVKLMDMRKNLKEAQFLSLQSQINPHFLFNTLNTIARTSMFEQATKTVRLIESLSSIFRYNLNKQEKSVTLKEELEILEEYMFIQKTRYGDRINFSIKSSIDLNVIKVPIFTLQPLVENAVKHGIEPKEDGGSISVEIDRKNELIVIKIIDTGIGFDSKNRDLSKPLSTSIGLDNVIKRLSLKFNGRENFIIDSQENRGTTITIEIPEACIV